MKIIHGTIRQQRTNIIWGLIRVVWDTLRGYTNTLIVRNDAVVRTYQRQRADGSFVMVFEVSDE